MAAVLPVIIVLLMVFALIDIITRDDWQVKHLPKFGWIILVILLPLIGTALWFAFGREYGGSRAAEGLGAMMATRVRPAAAPPAPAARPVDQRTTEEQLAELDREIEYYRRRAELERLKMDVEGEPTA